MKFDKNMPRIVVIANETVFSHMNMNLLVSHVDSM